MEGTALNGMYFFRTQPKYLRGEKSMSVTLGGAAEEEVENYRRLVKVGIVPKVQIMLKRNASSATAELLFHF